MRSDRGLPSNITTVLFENWHWDCRPSAFFMPVFHFMPHFDILQVIFSWGVNYFSYPQYLIIKFTPKSIFSKLLSIFVTCCLFKAIYNDFYSKYHYIQPKQWKIDFKSFFSYNLNLIFIATHLIQVLEEISIIYSIQFLFEHCFFCTIYKYNPFHFLYLYSLQSIIFYICN